MNRNTAILIAMTVAMAITGCSGPSSIGSSRMELRAEKISVPIPPGWVLDSSQMCHRNDSTGILMIEPLDGIRFVDRADAMSAEWSATVRSRTELRIGDHDAIRVTLDIGTGAVIDRLYIALGDSIVWVSFSVPETDHPTEAPAIDHALQAVTIG